MYGKGTTEEYLGKPELNVEKRGLKVHTKIYPTASVRTSSQYILECQHIYSADGRHATGYAGAAGAGEEIRHHARLTLP